MENVSQFSRNEAISASLCIAAMLNGTLVDSKWIDNAKLFLASEVEDYFAEDGHEQAQFNQTVTTNFLAALPMSNLFQLLHAMGKCPYCTMAFSDQWEKFVENPMRFLSDILPETMIIDAVTA